jgi:hypothetical protein
MKDKEMKVIVWHPDWPQGLFLTLDDNNLPKGVPINSWDDELDENFCEVMAKHTGLNFTVRRTIQTTNK